MTTCFGFLFVFSCQAAQVPPATIPYCDVARPIYWSTNDTRATKAAVDTENRKWKRLCGKTRPQ